MMEIEENENKIMVEITLIEKDIRSIKLWEKLVKELDVLKDNNYTARILFDYIEKHYGI
jgi:hypothetical protein